MYHHPPDRLDRKYFKPLWDLMRERAAIMAKDGGSWEAQQSDIAEWAWKTIDGMYPQPTSMPPAPKEPGFFGSTKKYRQDMRRYYETYDPQYFARRDVGLWLMTCSEGCLRDAYHELRQPAATVPVASATVDRGDLLWDSQGGRPEPMATCSPRQAEYLAKAWMEYLGATGCKVSQATRDGGVDVDSKHFVGEVKHHAVPVSPGIVRQIVGVASMEGKIPVVFSRSGYSAAALEVGRRGDAALFTYSFEQGTLRAASPQGEKALKLGLLSLTV
ncbi:hypothetical protein BJG92_03034 [Arthrobacter sp. SO5]|uniref:restriction endonuclease n=1 Tax=Arthrobacter sp. SO5 TaxID=1897055 RepID=UPI001E38820B|nr:restriction endonuclease [Arthrobacter sp. SO5]MCB5275483.1 hypothetical protein [Arthrobacter sp. SO5]